MPIIHSHYAGYVLPSGRVQRDGNFLAQGDPGFVPSDELQGQYDCSVDLPTEMRVTFDVQEDPFGNLSAVNVQPE